jgi:NADP-dependent 3-hydroxy acid dehydrogenase YdfG
VARRLHALAGDLTSEHLLTLVADVRDFAGMQAAVSRAIDHFGGIDVVMANAGIATMGSVLQVSSLAACAAAPGLARFGRCSPHQSANRRLSSSCPT